MTADTPPKPVPDDDTKPKSDIAARIDHLTEEIDELEDKALPPKPEPPAVGAVLI